MTPKHIPRTWRSLALLSALLLTASLGFAAPAAAQLDGVTTLGAGSSVALPLNAPVDASFTPGQADYYRIVLSQAAFLDITAEPLDGCDPELALMNNRIEFLAADPDHGPATTGARIARYLPAGTYYIAASNFSEDAGNYRIMATANAAPPLALAAGPTDLDAAGQVATLYSLTLAAPQQLSLESAGDLDMRAELWSAGTLQAPSALVAAADDTDTNANFRMAAFLPAGDYLLCVWETSGRAGTVGLLAGFDPAGATLPPRAQVDGVLVSGEDGDLYRVRLVRGQDLTLRISGLEVVVLLYDASGVLLDTFQVAAVDGVQEFLLGLLATGEYLIELRPAEGYGGEYTLSANLPPISVAPNLAPVLLLD